MKNIMIPSQQPSSFYKSIVLPTKWLLLFAGIIVLLQLGACGVKTAPYPEESTLPSKVRNLTQTLSENGNLTLTFLPPETNMVGRPLQKLGGFEVEVSENVADESYCVGCPHKYVTLDMIPAASPPPGLVLATAPYSWNFKVKPGRVYRFRVAGVSPSGGKHPGARTDIVVWGLESPGPLGGFSAGLGDRSVNLSWARPRKDMVVEIQKRLINKGSETTGAWSAVPGLDPTSGRFLDVSVEYEQSYTYRGRLGRVKDATIQPGPWSRERTVAVVDAVAPNPPGYLDASLANGGVRLNWESLSFNAEVAGYRVYRQLLGEAGFTRIGPGLIRTNTFFDPIKLTKDAVARYKVTAVDKSRRANEGLSSPTVDVLLDPPPVLPVRPQ